jgi:ADP-ribose pyrophosphatase YjhB (NUDIX family)
MNIEPCADIIATHQGKIVLVERLSEPKGLALPGGRLDARESLEECAVREFKEETGMHLTLKEQFKTYSDPTRDPRGQKVSTVFVGEAQGAIKDEAGKTRVHLVSPEAIEEIRETFVFDHYSIK